MLHAIKAVNNKKMKVPMAARKYNVPVSPLYDHTRGKVAKIGPGAPTVLREMEEKEIVISLQVLQEMGFGLTKELVRIAIQDYQSYRPNPFRDGLPGSDWWQLFLKRWKSQLSVRKPHNTILLKEKNNLEGFEPAPPAPEKKKRITEWDSNPIKTLSSIKKSLFVRSFVHMKKKKKDN